jgi:hypothetical protein
VAAGSAAPRPFALSFWVKSNVTGTYIVELYDIDNTRQVSASYTILSSGTWEYKTIMFPIDISGLLDYDNNNSLQCTFWLTAGSTFSSGTLNTSWASATNANRAVGQVHLAAAVNNYWQVTGVQLEANYQPTPFEQRPFGAELSLCQRYYQRIVSGAELATQAIAIGQAYATTVARIPVRYARMRANPNAASSVASQFSLTNSAGSYTALSTITFGELTPECMYIDATVGSAVLVAGNATWLRLSNSAGFIELSAEL